VLEIATRSDARTVVRFAAACRTLRRRILAATFIQRLAAAGTLPSCMLARLHTRRQMRRRRNPLVSLVHPATPAASSFVGKQLAPFVSRRAADLLRRYDPIASRGGLVLLRRRRHFKTCTTSGSDLCVYDPMSGARTSLSEPPDISMDGVHMYSVRSCVLLTSVDGIDSSSSFLLLVADMSILNGSTMRLRVQIATSSDVSWGPVTKYTCSSGPFQNHGSAVVLPGGIIHWLGRNHNEIFSYDVRTGHLEAIKHPNMTGQRHLSISSDGKLRILVVQRFTISIWLQLSGGWALDAVIDTEEKMRSLDPSILSYGLGLNLECSGESRSNAVLIHTDGGTIVLDLETREMRKQEDLTSTFPLLFDVDLPARLQAMKHFS
jgi:hypothetical protein